MMDRFDGRVVIVTGGARGIGRTTARRFAQEGASVAVVDLDAETAEVSAAELPGGPHLGIAADVSVAEQVDAAVQRTVAELGGLHVVMNNAGLTRDNLLHKMTEADWDLVMSVHLKGAFLVSKAAQVVFVEQRYGKLVNVSSISALGNRGQANYSAAKMGIQGFTRTVAIELGKYGINVNAVAPGFVATEMTDATAVRLGMTVDEFHRSVADQTPLRRIGLPEDIASAVLFLASDEASYITGQTLYVDGGRSL